MSAGFYLNVNKNEKGRGKKGEQEHTLFNDLRLGFKKGATGKRRGSLPKLNLQWEILHILSTI